MNLTEKYQHKILIAGPCSGESREQMESVFRYIQENSIPTSFIRAGVWKPRSRPGSFEGLGEQVLTWLSELQETYQIPAIVEIAKASQIDLLRKQGMNAFWIGARTAADPFQVQELADAIRGDRMTVFVKNPIHPDLPLWIGNVERIAKANKGLTGAIHRGFSVYDSNEKYRNRPFWTIPLEFKRLMPEYPLLCDPSHITGKRDMVFDVGQKAWNMDFDGLMVETHPTPDEAMSDAAQQVTFQQLLSILKSWQVFGEPTYGDDHDEELNRMRKNIDTIDGEIIELLVSRSKICEDIGMLKNQMNIPAYVPERWSYILESRTQQALEKHISPHIVKAIYQQIHQMSIAAQNKHLLKKNEKDNIS